MNREGIKGSALPSVATEILASLGKHRILSSTQIHTIHTPGRSSRWAQRVMARMEVAGLVARVTAPGRLRRGLWFLTETGANLVREATELDEEPMVLEPRQVRGPLYAHTSAVNDAAICFLKEARRRGDDFGPLAWHHEVVHPLGHGRGRRRRVLRADAVFT